MSSFSIDAKTWAEQQFAGCHLGDNRRTKRLVRMATKVASNPSGSIPEQMETWGDMKAAYRLFDAEGVTHASVTAPHREQTMHQPAGRYLVLGDTTEIDFGIHRDVADLGPTGNGGGWGFLLHTGLMVAAESDATLGIAGQTIYYRRPAPKRENTTKRLKRQRESQIWGQVIDQIGSPPESLELVHVLDRGADNFEVFCHLHEQNVHGVIRAAQLRRHIITPDDQALPLATYLDRLPVAGAYELSLRARPRQAARTATLEVRYGPLGLPVPKHKSPSIQSLPPEPIALTVVWVREIDPPKGTKPIEWVLYTSLPVTSFDLAWTVIEYYERRWLIEEYHKALKSGCRVNGRQLKTRERLEAMVGLMAVTAVRLLQLKAIARTDPDQPAEAVVPQPWIAMLQAVRQKRRPLQRLTVGQFYRELAMLGGFIGRASDGDPGWITIWRGWEKLNLMVRGAALQAKAD